MPETQIILVQLGSPRSPRTRDVRHYLKDFLSDPRVVDLPRWAWALILWLFVLPWRPRKSAQAYRRIWNGHGFPLVELTHSLVAKMNALEGSPKFVASFILSPPQLKTLLEQWEKEKKRSVKWLIVPQFPQYCEATTLSVVDQFSIASRGRVLLPQVEWVTHFHLAKVFIDSLAEKIWSKVLEVKGEAAFFKGELPLLLSFHGLPVRRVVEKKDPYYRHCFETAEALMLRLQQMTGQDVRPLVHVSFQSRFGSEEWLGPSTTDKALELVERGQKHLMVCSPSFVVDCLETIDELGHELRLEVEKAQGKLTLVACLNDDDSWAQKYAGFLSTLAQGSAAEKKYLFYDDQSLNVEHTMPEAKLKSPPLSPEAKSSLKIVFLTLFLDLVGFSIIFPLFPALAKHYLSVDADNVFLRTIFDGITSFISFGSSSTSITPVVLFGGILGALYSFLQFLAAPFWGSLSDRIGRRPILLISVAGLMLSYLLWFFSGSFTLLIAARFLGGIMAGNISTATAVVADITVKENRSKGMAFIGIAFALGFIIGPAVGGLSSLLDLTPYFPESWGVNPFSGAALISFLLSLFNLIYLALKFKETLPPEKRGKKEQERSVNPLVLFRPLPYKGVNLTNFGHFLFLMAFSGMEFTLTFLMHERFQYTSMQNAYLFIYIGFILVMVQGGVVRRKAHQVGEKKMALMGLITLLPGLLIIGVAQTVPLIYLGLFFLAVGSAMTIPCLTTLASLFGPPEHQGRTLGVFRSLGALGRVLGPLLASILYWRWGSASPYWIGSAFLLIPILMIAALPVPKGNE